MREIQGARFGSPLPYPLAYAMRKVYKHNNINYVMRKIIKKWGEGLGIYFTKDEIKMDNFQEGNVIDLTITRVDKEVKDD